MFRTLRHEKHQQICKHSQVEHSSFNGISRSVCAECHQVSFESTGDSIQVGGVPSPRHEIDAR